MKKPKKKIIYSSSELRKVEIRSPIIYKFTTFKELLSGIKKKKYLIKKRVEILKNFSVKI